MHSAIWIFIATFISVLGIGVEMRAIAKHKVWLAAFSACIIAGGQLVAFKLVPSSTNLYDYLAYILANGIGIMISFKVYAKASNQTNTFQRPLESCGSRTTCMFNEEHACTDHKDSCLVYIAVDSIQKKKQ